MDMQTCYLDVWITIRETKTTRTLSSSLNNYSSEPFKPFHPKTNAPLNLGSMHIIWSKYKGSGGRITVK